MAEQAEPNFLQNIKEKYLELVEKLAEKGLPFPHLIVPLVLILILAIAAFYLAPGVFVEKKNVSLTVKDTLGRSVSGAVVQVLVNNQSISETRAGQDGTVSLQGVPVNAIIRVSADGFTPASRDVSSLSGSITLRSLQPETQDVNVRVVDSQGQSVQGAQVQLTFANGDFAPLATTDASGNAIITVEQSMLSQGTISVTAVGVQATQQPVTVEQLESTTPITITVQLTQRDPTSVGDFTIHVSSAGSGVQNAVVTLIDVATSVEKKKERTYQDGSVVFENVSYGEAFTVQVKHPQFETYSQEFTPTANANELPIQLARRSTPQSTITITLLNAERTGIEGVVKLFDAASNNLIESQDTNANGEATFTVSQSTNAYATAYSEGYLPGFLAGIAAGAVKTIALEEVLPGNSVSVTVVVREDGFPASNAEVALYRFGGYFLGIPALTAGGEGIANATIPLAVEGAAYKVYAKASKQSASGQSDVVDVTSAPLSLTVDLVAMPANVSITLKDLATDQLIPNGAIEALVEGIPVSSCTVLNGTCVLPVAANKEFTIRATAPGYLTYVTSTKTFSPAEQAKETVTLFPVSLAQSATVNFLGLFDSRGVKAKEVANAETYSAKFAVNMPQNVDENAGFYVQVGDEQTTAESSAVITSFNSNGAPYVQSDSELKSVESTENNGELDNSTTSTSATSTSSCYNGKTNAGEEMKWVYFSFPRGFTGTREFVVNVKVSKTAEAGAEIKINYKAFAFKDGLPLIYPSDTELLDSLRQQIDEGLRLTPEDTCQMRVVTQSIPVTQQTLTCTEDDVCWKAILFDSASQGNPSTYQPQIAKDFTFELELLSPVSIDSLGLTTEHFNVKNSRQTLSGLEKVSFADDGTATTTASAITTSGRTFNLPFTSLPNKKAKMSMTLTPLQVSQDAPLTFTLRSGSKTFQIPVQLTVSGTNAFTATIAPSTVPALQDSKITIVVRDKNNNYVETAAVGLYECANSPFSGNEPEQLLGDGSQNNGLTGRYRVDVNPTGLGEIGARVEAEGFKTLETCSVTVQGKNFLAIDPESMEFTGSSLEPQAQQVTLSNALNEPIRVATSINCGGDPVPLKVFPTSITIEPNSDSTLSLKILNNVTSNTNCLATFTARAGTYRVAEELPLMVDVECPGCINSAATGSDSSPLPGAITLITMPPFLQDSYSIPLRLSADPTCRLSGLRMNYAGQYQQGYSQGYGQGYGQTYQGGVLGGMPTPVLWWCTACTMPMNGQSQCNQCQQVTPSQWGCGACVPNPVTAPTSSQLPVHLSATCSACQTGQGAYQAQAFMSPLSYNGYQTPYNQAFQPYNQQQQVSYDRSTGGILRQDYGYGANQYNRPGAYPVGLPGSQYGPNYNNYNGNGYNQYQMGNGFSQNSVKDAVQIDECTKDAITVTADYSFVGQPYPATGNLEVTLPDGARKTIRVNVIAAPQGPMMGGPTGIPFGAQTWDAACGETETRKVSVTPAWKFASPVTVQLTCPIVFDKYKIISVQTKDNSELSQASCNAELKDNELITNCDFKDDAGAIKALENDGKVFVKLLVSSAQNVNAKVEVKIMATYEQTKVAKEAPEAQVQLNPAEPAEPPAHVEAPIVSASNKQPKIQVLAGTKDVCNGNAMSGEELTIKSSFPSGGNERKVIVTKQQTGGSFTDEQTFTGAKEADTQKYTVKGDTGQRFGFKASAIYPTGQKVSDDCIVTLTDRQLLIDKITPGYFKPATPATFNIFRLTFPEHLNRLTKVSTKVELDKTRLATLGKKDVYIAVQYSCKDKTTQKVTELNQKKYTLKAPNYKVADKTLAETAVDSLEFSRCDVGVNAVNEYTIKVELQTAAPVGGGVSTLETRYYQCVQKNGDPADCFRPTIVTTQAGQKAEGQATPLSFVNYPETPFSLPTELNKATFDACGRIGAPLTSAIELQKTNVDGTISYLKDGDAIAPGDSFILRLCTDPKYDGETAKFRVEYQNEIDQIGLIDLGSKQIYNGVSSVSFDASSFLAADVISNNHIKVKKPVAFRAEIESRPSSTRYMCKYWPNLNEDCHTSEAKASFRLDNTAYYDKNCVKISAPNPNWLRCQLEIGDSVQLATGQYFRLGGIDLSKPEIKFVTAYDPAFSDKMDCNLHYDNPIGLGDVLGRSGEGVGVGNSRICGESIDNVETPLLLAKFIQLKKKPKAFTGVGSVDVDVAEVELYSVFGPLDKWLNEDYHYNFDVYSDEDKLIRQVKFRKPIKKLADFAISDSDNTEGIYNFSVNDVTKLKISGTTAILRFVGTGNNNGQYLFEVRDNEKAIGRNCGGGNSIGLTGFALGLLCFAPGTNIAGCPIILGLAGAIGGISVENLWKAANPGPFFLPAKLDDTISCSASGLSPGISVRVLKTAEREYNLRSGNKVTLPQVCAVISNDGVSDELEGKDFKPDVNCNNAKNGDND
ncbi:MAG: carboxypeptidase-like regulatory domain-containing protein [Candidatus Micrarchaeota archaeon]